MENRSRITRVELLGPVYRSDSTAAAGHFLGAGQEEKKPV